MATRLYSQAHEHTVARLGGDEFVVLIGELSADPMQAALQVEHIGEKICGALANPMLCQGRATKVLAALASPCFPMGADSKYELLKRADIAMYQAKARVATACVFSTKKCRNSSPSARLEADMQFALVREQFELHYQPQFNRAGQMVGAEALLRWRHPQRGMVSPAEFHSAGRRGRHDRAAGAVGVAHGLPAFGRRQQQPTLAGAQLSVNVSARQFRQADGPASHRGAAKQWRTSAFAQAGTDGIHDAGRRARHH